MADAGTVMARRSGILGGTVERTVGCASPRRRSSSWAAMDLGPDHAWGAGWFTDARLDTWHLEQWADHRGGDVSSEPRGSVIRPC